MFTFICIFIIVVCIYGAINKTYRNKKEQELRERAIADEKQHVANVERLDRLSQLEQAYRIVYDSMQIITSSHNVDTVINRCNDFAKYYPVLRNASSVELRDSGIILPNEFYESAHDIIDEHDDVINIAIKRSFEYEMNDADKLKTRTGKVKRIAAHTENLMNICSLTDTNKQFIELCANQCFQHIERSVNA